MKQDYVTIKGTLVKDHKRQYSYNLTNKHDAKILCQTLNQSYTILDTYRNIETQYDNITKQIIQLKLTVNILSDEINHLQEVIQECKSQ
jgi:hypothetical protein